MQQAQSITTPSPSGHNGQQSLLPSHEEQQTHSPQDDKDETVSQDSDSGNNEQNNAETPPTDRVEQSKPQQVEQVGSAEEKEYKFFLRDDEMEQDSEDYTSSEQESQQDMSEDEGQEDEWVSALTEDQAMKEAEEMEEIDDDESDSDDMQEEIDLNWQPHRAIPEEEFDDFEDPNDYLLDGEDEEFDEAWDMSLGQSEKMQVPLPGLYSVPRPHPVILQRMNPALRKQYFYQMNEEYLQKLEKEGGKTKKDQQIIDQSQQALEADKSKKRVIFREEIGSMSFKKQEEVTKLEEQEEVEEGLVAEWQNSNKRLVNELGMKKAQMQKMAREAKEAREKEQRAAEREKEKERVWSLAVELSSQMQANKEKELVEPQCMQEEDMSEDGAGQEEREEVTSPIEQSEIWAKLAEKSNDSIQKSEQDPNVPKAQPMEEVSPIVDNSETTQQQVSASLPIIQDQTTSTTPLPDTNPLQHSAYPE